MADDGARVSVVLEAKIDKLTEKLSAANRAVYGASAKMQKDLSAAEGRFAGLFGKADPGKALERVFSSARLATIEAGTSRIRLFGSAVEALGPIGVAGAAGIAAVVAAFAGARDAARFADDIHDTAERLHVTTDALQEFRYAIRAAGGDEKGADEALAAFSETLGKASEGLPKALRGFRALFGNGFTANDVKRLGDTEHALVAVQKAMQGLSNTQKDAAVAQFGLTGLKELVEGPTEEMQRLREEAHKVGIVMDAELVKRGGELNDKFETVEKVISIQLKSALVDLGPVLVGILQVLADMAKAANDVVDSFKAIEDRQSESLKRQRQFLVERDQADPLRRVLKGGQDQRQIASIDAELARRAANQKSLQPPITHSLADQSKAKTGPRDDTAERTESVNAALAAAGKALLEGQKGLTASVAKRAEIEQAIAREELAGELARLEKQKASIEADKGISAATKKTLAAKLDAAEFAVKVAAGEKIEAIKREAAFAIEDRQIQVYKDTVEAQIATLGAEADIATTAAQRKEIEARILKLRQQLEADLRGVQLDRELVTGAITPEQHARETAALNQGQAAERKSFDVAHENPIEQFQRELGDFTTFTQNEAVGAIKDLSAGLADAIVNAKDLGDVARNVFLRLISDLIERNLESSAVKLLALIPGFASGTSSAPGGLAWVGERGPELLRIPAGSQVIPNHALRASGGQPGATAPAFVFLQPLQLDLRHAVLTSDLVGQMQTLADRGRDQAIAIATRVASKNAPARLAAHQMLGS